MELHWRPGTRHQFADALSRSHGNKTQGATVDDSFPDDNTTKRTYRGPQGPVFYGIPLGQLGIQGINSNNALFLTVFAAVTFTSNLPPADTNPVRHRSRAHSLDSAPVMPKAVVIGCGGGVAFGYWMTFSNAQVSPTTTVEHWNAPARTVCQPTQYSNKLVEEI